MEHGRKSILPATLTRLSPNDKCHLVYLIFYLLGIGSLMPWNFFITAKQYFQFKLRNVTDPVAWDDPNADSSDLQASFEAYIAVASALPNFIFNILNALLTKAIPLKVRMVGSLFIMLVIFSLTDVFVYVNTDNWQTKFFIITIITVIITSGATSVMSGAMFGLSGSFPPKYTQAAMSGQAMGGTFAALADILSLVAGTSVTDSAFGYFLSAALVIILSTIGFIGLYFLHYSRFHMGMEGSLAASINYTIAVESDDQNEEPEESESEEDHTVEVPVKSGVVLIMKEIWPQAVSVFVVFATTLAVFPGVCSSIVSEKRDNHSLFTNKYFSPIICFLLFNIGDWSGRMVAGWLQLIKSENHMVLLLVTFLRMGLVPLLLLCNAQPREHIPVIFTNDAWPVVFIILLGISNGYISTLAMMHGPAKVLPQHAEMAGAWMSVFLTGGLAVGSLVSLGLVNTLFNRH